MWALVMAACLDPVAFGAIANDDHSDTAAFQRAIDEASHTGSEVCVRDGVWLLDRTKKQLGSLMITRGPLTIRGRGPRTILRMAGDGGKGHWAMIEMRGARGIVLRDLAIDGLGAYNTEEQTHLVEIGPATQDVVIANTTFGPMRKPGERVGGGIGGDCIRLLGNPGSEVERVVIAHSRFIDCDRSAIGVQRSQRDITISDIEIRGTGDTPIDFEPTGRGTIEDFTMVGMTIERSPQGQGAWSITVGGIGEDLARYVTIADSTLGAGGVGMINVADIAIAQNVITHRAGIEGTISVMRRGSGIQVVRNRIARPADAPPGPLVRATFNNGLAPRGVLVEGNDLHQATPAPVVYSASAGGLVVRDNYVDYSGLDPDAGIVVAEARAADVDSIRICDNRIYGRAGKLLVAAARTHGFDSVELRNNELVGTGGVAICDGRPELFRSFEIDRMEGDVRGNCRASAARPPAGSPAARPASRR